MDRRVRVAAPDRLLEGREQVVVVVPLPVVAHGAALGDLLGVGQGDGEAPVRGLSRLIEELHGVEALAHIAAAGGGDIGVHPLLHREGQLALLPHDAKSPLDGRQHVRRREGLELKDRAAAEQGVEHTEIGVLRGGGNEGDLPVFHELQQALLLALVEVLDLIQVQQHPIGGNEGADIPHDVPDILGAGGGGVEPVQGAAGPLGDDIGHRSLSHAGGAVEDHIGVAAAVDKPAQQAAGAQQVLLPHHIVQRLRPDAVSQWLFQI